MPKTNRERVELPPRSFLYTIDQLAALFEVQESSIYDSYLFYENRSVGVRPVDRMYARNIAPAGAKPEWRVAENELIRWMKVKGFRFHTRGYFQ